MKSNNGKRLVAAVAIFAMLACCLAIALPASEGTGDNGPLDFDATDIKYVDEETDYGTTDNVALGNHIEVTYDAGTKTYVVTGYLGYQPTNSTATDEEKTGPFYTMDPANNEDNYGLALTFEVADGTKFWLNDKEFTGDGEAVSALFYLNDADTEKTVSIGTKENKYTIDLNAIIYGAETDTVWNGTATTEEITGNLIVAANTTANQAIVMPAGATITILEGATLTVDLDVTNAVTEGDRTIENFYGISSTNTLNIAGEGTLKIVMDIEDFELAAGKNTTKVAAISATGAINIQADIVIDVNGNVTDKATDDAYKYSEAVYGIYAPGEVTVANCNVDITVAENDALAFAVSGPASNKTYTFTNVTGQITGGNRGIQTGSANLTFIGCDMTVSGNEKAIQANTANGSVTIKGSNLTLKLIDSSAIQYNGGQNDRYGIKVNDLTVDTDSTLVTDGMRLFNIDATEFTLTNNGVIIVYGGYTQNADSEDPNAVAGLKSDKAGFLGNVLKGVPTAADKQYIYLADGASTFNVTVIGTVEDGVTGEYAFSKEEAQSKIEAGATEITILAVGGNADIDGLEIPEGVTVKVGGAATGTVDGVTFNSVSGASFTTVDGVLTLVMAGTGADAAITGTITVADNETLAVDEGAVFNGTFNGLTLKITAGAGFYFGAEPVEVADEPTITNARALAAPAPLANTASFPVMGGSMDLAAGVSGKNLILDDAELTTSVEGGITIDVTDLTIRGDVTIGAGVTILVKGGSTLTIAADSTLTGEGTLKVTGTGKIVNNGTADAIGVKIDSADAKPTPVTDVDGFIGALLYYDTITVAADSDLVFSKDALSNLGITVVEVLNKTVILESGSSITIGEGIEIDFVNSTVRAAEGATEAPTMTVEGIIGIDDSNIYMSVTAEKENIDAVNNVMNVDGSSIDLGTVGFGRVLNINGDFTIGNTTGDLTVYGEVNVNSGVTLTLNQGSNIKIMAGGSLSVAGNAVIGGNITADGEIAVDGTVTVSSTGNISGAGKVIVNSTYDMDGTQKAALDVYGTANINGTMTCTATLYDGATLNVEKATGTVTVVSGTSYKAPATAAANTPKIVINENKVVLANVSGIVITAEEAVASETKEDVTTNTYTSTFDISGSITAGTVTVKKVADDAATTDVTEGAGDVVISSEMTLADKVTLVNESEIAVSGTLAAADGAAITNNGTIDVTGKVTVTDVPATGATASASIGGTGTVNATYYDVTDATTKALTRTYTTFDAAVDAIAGADKTTVTVSGKQTSSVDKTVTGTVAVPSGAELTVGSGVTLTFGAQGYMLNGNTTDKKVLVDGTLVFEAYANYSEGNAATTTEVAKPKIKADVAIIEGASRTYTSLANAIDMAAGEETTITLNDNVTVKEDLEIPENITVSSDEFGIYIGEATSTKNVTLTVLGSVQLIGNENIDLVSGASIQGATAEPKKYKGQLVLEGDGYVYLADDTGVDQVTGAHYQKDVDFGTADAPDKKTVDVISTVQHAADDSANVKVANGNAAISVYGETSVVDAVFTAPKDATLTVDVKADASITGDMTIGAGVTIVGAVTGTVGITDAAVAIDGSATIAAVAQTNEDETTVTILTIVGAVTGDVTVSEGTVYVNKALALDGTKDEPASLGIASGAVLKVTKTGTITSDSEYETVSVEGTLDIEKPDTADEDQVGIDNLAVTGTVNVNGGLTVKNVTDNGTVNVNGAMAVNGILTVGNKPVTLGTPAGEGVLTVGTDGKLSFGTGAYMKAYNGASVTVPEGVASTSFTINGQLYMTVYTTADDVTLETVLLAETYTLQDLYTGLKYANPAMNDGLYDMGNWYTSSNMVKNTALTDATADSAIGAEGFTALYAQAEPVPVDGTVSEGMGLRLYIDGIPAENLVGEKGAISLGVGEHVFSYEVLANYDGTNAKITLTVNGQSNTIDNGGKFTIQSSMGGFVLAANGAVPATQGGGDIIVPAPEVVVKDNGDMSLTDYLLIILVVLIVIMAIIVALRLMRS